MHVSESLAVGSIQAFLADDDLADFDRAMVDVYSRVAENMLTADARDDSVHSIDGFSTKQAMRVYEPAGRDELMHLPPAALDVLERAATRAMPTIKVMLPSVREMGYWTFVSYTENQFITPHIDLSDNDPDPSRPKVAGLSISLTAPQAYGGGEFFVETACDPEQWTFAGNGTPRVRSDCDESSDWYRRQRRLRWTVRPERGDALLYGSQQTHGTEPVTWGRISKVIGFLIS